MHAMILRAHGGPEVLEWAEVERPSPGPEDVLVRVEACGVNYLDIWTRRGKAGRPGVFPQILGNEPVGRIAELGANVRNVALGDRVVVSPGQLARFHADRSGWDARFDDYAVIGAGPWGGYAEYVAANAENILKVSDRWKPEEWAATPLAFLTAWHMLVGRARVLPGETVLVIGGGSGVGSATIQIAAHFACRVLTTAGTAEKLAKALALGAHEAVSHADTGWPERVRELTGGRGVDVVVEHVGEAVFSKALTTLAYGGRIVTCGATTGPKAEVHLTHLFAKQLSLLGSYMGDFAELKEVAALLEAGKLRPVVDRVFPIREVADAHRRMEARELFGKIVLRHDSA